jgi:hypothetical protein
VKCALRRTLGPVRQPFNRTVHQTLAITREPQHGCDERLLTRQIATSNARHHVLQNWAEQGLTQNVLPRERRIRFGIVGHALILLLLLSGCAWHYPPKDGRLHLDAPHPSAERIAELAQTQHLAMQSAPWLRLSSPFVVAGHGVRLSCFVPRNTPNLRAMRLALVDEVSPLRNTASETNSAELLIESVPCGTYVVACDALANFGRVLIHQEQTFTSRGSCNAAGDDR